MDSIRSPASSRSPSLGNVPEHGAFAIGDDDDDDEDLETLINSPHSRSHSIASASADDAVPTQTRSMSEKARGKQPVGHGSFSRSASRNTSNTSLSSLQTQTPHPLTTSTQFTPTGEWLESWLPHLPLHTILQVIADGRSGTPRPSRQPVTPNDIASANEIATTPNSECKSPSPLPSTLPLPSHATSSNTYLQTQLRPSASKPSHGHPSPSAGTCPCYGASYLHRTRRTTGAVTVCGLALPSSCSILRIARARLV